MAEPADIVMNAGPCAATNSLFSAPLTKYPVLHTTEETTVNPTIPALRLR